MVEGTGVVERTGGLEIQPWIDVKEIGDDVGLHTNTSVTFKRSKSREENLIETASLSEQVPPRRTAVVSNADIARFT